MNYIDELFQLAIDSDKDFAAEVAKRLSGIGGKWTTKAQGFVFDFDPSDLLAEISTGTKRNLKKEFQYFETPERLAKQLVELAEIKDGQNILEPSAGKGAIVRKCPAGNFVFVYEVNELFHEQLQTLDVILAGKDFLQADESVKFDRIVANPPFSKNQDIDHIRKMYGVLAAGGVLVSIASTHWQMSNNKKEAEFREWLDEAEAEVMPVPSGAFKESGTNIPTVIIKIRKIGG